ncbi:GSCFA domain protein [Babesia caballi]|uniref:GSCFA domain protein n=1 Tax=Babesia caballi TaxID=5871 RepID=A0AAV4M187_BABCB|nr:GSCFA domain protein [Babesia caballi]
MTYWWDNIQQPETLKEALELLAAIRTNQVLRNEICNVFTEHINGRCNPQDASQRHPFHKLLDDASVLSGRMMGQPQNCKLEDYGKYQTIYNSGCKLTYCNGTISGCSRRVRDGLDNSGACLATIHDCADKIVDILLRVLPKLYNALNSLLARLWDDVKWFLQSCNDKNGELYKLLTLNSDIHDKEGCPYKTLEKLEIGVSQDDMRSNSRADKVEAAIKSLVWPTGSLSILIDLIKKNKTLSSSMLYAKIGNINPSNTRCLCIVPKAELSKATTPIVKPSVRSRRSVPRAPVRKPRQKAQRGTSDKIESTDETKNQANPVNTDPSVAKAHDGPGSVSNITTRTSTIATTSNDSAASNIANRDTANKFLFMNPYYVTGSYQKNNYKWHYDSRTSMYSEAPSQPTIYNITAAQSTQSGSRCAASGAAVGCLLVGCVGVGAAYGFNIGGFGTMVNSLF